MTAPAAERGIEALDTSLPVLNAQLAESARQRAHLRACYRAEYAHLLHDADPDSTVPAFVVSLTKNGAVTR